MPWELIYIEKFNNKIEAVKREKQIKSYKGGEAFKRLIKNIITINGRVGTEVVKRGRL